MIYQALIHLPMLNPPLISLMILIFYEFLSSQTLRCIIPFKFINYSPSSCIFFMHLFHAIFEILTGKLSPNILHPVRIATSKPNQPSILSIRSYSLFVIFPKDIPMPLRIISESEFSGLRVNSLPFHVILSIRTLHDSFKGYWIVNDERFPIFVSISY